MAEITLRNGGVALIDDEDFARISARRWWNDGRGYAAVRVRSLRKTIKMHREVMNAPDGMQVDHINGNRLDNRRQNLRLCTQSQNNAAGRMSRTRTSQYRGVHWCNRDRAFIARCGGQRNTYIGQFSTEIEAAKAYDRVALSLYGEFARPNFPADA